MQVYLLMIISILIVFFYLASRKSKFFKACLTFTVFAVYIVYIVLRIFSVPIMFGFTSSVLGIALLIAEIIGFSAFAVYIFIFYTPKSVKVKPINKNNTELPVVDVLICTYNEPIELVMTTIIGAMHLDYPKNLLNVYILDDGHRPEFKALADELNIYYITRASNENAKAGNINNALKYIKGDLFLVLDADMIPKREFLQRVVGQFEDENIAFVQIPQTFYNADIYQYNLRGKYYNEQDFFMRCIEPARNSKDAVLHIGTNTVFRRAYVESVGGYPTTSITEDMALGLKLQARGYSSTFINETLVCGLSAFNLKDSVKQRDRWCRGNLQVIKEFKKEFKKKLTFKQKIIYIDGVVYWFTGITKLIFLITPVIHILTGVPIINYNRLYLIPLFFVLFFGQIFLSKRILPKKISKNYLEFFYNGNIYNTVMAPHLTYSIFKHYLFPDIKFSVTNKNMSQKKTSISFKYIWFSLLLLVLHIVSLYIATKNVIAGKLYLETFFINVFWIIYNLPSLFVAVKLGFQKPRGYDYINIKEHIGINMNIGSQKLVGRLKGISSKSIKVEVPARAIKDIHKIEDVSFAVDNININGKIDCIRKNNELEVVFSDDLGIRERIAINLIMIKFLKPYEDNYV